MQNNGIRIIKAAQPVTGFVGSFDHTHNYMQGYVLDLTRKTAILMRQSRRGADEDNPESRLRQEGLRTSQIVGCLPINSHLLSSR